MENTLKDFETACMYRSYAVIRAYERGQIKALLKKGLKPKFYNRNYCELDKITYNGWSPDDIEKIYEEIKNENSL